MKNFRRAGFIKTVAHTAAVESGEPIAIGAKAGVASGAYAENAEGEYLQAGVHVFKKQSAVAFSQGDLVSWDAVGKQVVPDGDVLETFKLGECDLSVGASATEIEVLVNGAGYPSGY